MCDGDDDDCWLPVIIAPPADMSLLLNDRSFVAHWRNRPCWTFSDPSTNYTLRTENEPIVGEQFGSVLSNRGSPVLLPVRYVVVLVLPKTVPSHEKDKRPSYSSQTCFRPWVSFYSSAYCASFKVFCVFLSLCPLENCLLGYCTPGLFKSVLMG